MGGIRVTDARSGFRLAVWVGCVLGGLILIMLVLNRPRPLLLPAGWPLTELKPPPGALEVRRPGWQGRAVDPSASAARETANRRRCWEIAFGGSFGWEELVQHTDRVLFSLGYECVEPRETGAAGKARLRTYLSPDRSLSVTVAHFKGAQTMLFDAYDFYTYELVEY